MRTKKNVLILLLAMGFSYAQAQNVGIGEPNPGSKLSVKGGLSVGGAYSAISAPDGTMLLENKLGIGTTEVDSNAILDIRSSTKGIILPRMSKEQRESITNPVQGLMVFDTDSNTLFFNDGTSWFNFPAFDLINNKVRGVSNTILNNLGLGGLLGGGSSSSGTTWHTGTTTPTALTSGSTGDFYLNTTDHKLYKKTSAILWTLQTDLTGPAGADGRGYESITSSTSVSIATGNKTFTVNDLGAYAVGSRIRAAYASDPDDKYMEGVLTSKTASSITIDVDLTEGSGSYNNWNFSIAGNRGATGPAGSGLANGSSAGNTPYWNGTAWVVNSSNIYNNGGNVGIGTSTPQKPLEVYASKPGTGIVNIKNPSSSGYSSIDFFDHNGNQMGNVGFANSSASNYAGMMYFATNTADDMVFGTDNVERVRFTDNGKVGIGTSTPSYTLDVNGTGRFTGTLRVGSYTLPSSDGSNGQVLTTNGSGTVSWTTVTGGGSGGSGNYDNTYYNRGSAAVSISSSSWSTLSGLSRSVTLTESGKLKIQTSGGTLTTSTNSSGYSVIDVAIYIDGVQVASTYGGGIQRTYAQNSSGYKAATAAWSTFCVLDLSSGSHTIEVKARKESGSTATVSGNDGNVLQGVLITEIFYDN
jgi:hypothetical protein